MKDLTIMEIGDLKAGTSILSQTVSKYVKDCRDVIKDTAEVCTFVTERNDNIGSIEFMVDLTVKARCVLIFINVNEYPETREIIETIDPYDNYYKLKTTFSGYVVFAKKFDTQLPS